MTATGPCCAATGPSTQSYPFSCLCWWTCIQYLFYTTIYLLLQLQHLFLIFKVSTLYLNHFSLLTSALKVATYDYSFPSKSLLHHSETLPQNPTMAEETRWCHSCKKDRPKDLFRAPEDAGKEFWKMCEPCRIKYRNVSISHAQMGKEVHLLIRSGLNITQISRARRSQGGGGRARPYYLPEPAPQKNIRISNSQAGMASESTSATPTTTAPEQPKCLYAGASHHSRVTVTPPVVETSAQSTTTTTVITISTITSKNVTETSIKVEEDTKTAQSGIQQVEDENPESLSSGPESEQQSEASSSANQRPELFACLHCERLRPWPMAGLHICLLCIRDWKWCAKGAHNQAKVNFLWDDQEHDECYMCHFAGI